ncbi:glycosyltransferase family 87 protein [Algoriphagus sp. AK58]|uniref:glycosyltransferase family 87 protein n=1 Tax=Algoriphagus sp. AK58 TaxID=1406877 RepID=UPI00165099E0|nr:glycosyltransferase family 87 protein [Algoriphagus sp. AK58]
MSGILFFLARVPRESFGLTFLLFSMAFAGMAGLFFLAGEKLSFRNVLFAGLLLRLAVFPFAPQWSDDFVRFLWDGEMLKIGQNPYSQTPQEWQKENFDPENAYLNQLFDNLNSPDYYSVYPPLNQAIFWLGAKASMGFVWNGNYTLRLILLLGEIGVFVLLWKLLMAFQLPTKRIFWYWLNPLVIMEITGNLHMEGLVLLFLLASIWAIQKVKLGLSGGFWGVAIGIKLLPLMLGPSFLVYEKSRKSAWFWVGTGLTTLISFTPLFIDSSWVNFLQSLQLYQGKFEFNASIYYLLREVGYWIEGYNTIAFLTKILSLFTVILIWYFSLKRQPKSLLELVDLMVLIYLVYLILQPVVHPWYILPALGLSVLRGKLTFLLWSSGAIFSYQAYGNPDFQEQSIFLILEYGLVVLGIYLDYFSKKMKPHRHIEVT